MHQFDFGLVFATKAARECSPDTLAGYETYL